MSAWWILADLTDQDRKGLTLWLGILLGVVVVGCVLILLIRKLLRDPINKGGPNAGFSLSELREMRDRGEITSAEYEQTRAMVIAKIKAASERDQAAKSADEPPPA